MNGAEHYIEAERLVHAIAEPLQRLQEAFEIGEDVTAALGVFDLTIATAQAHATLAHAAATALAAVEWSAAPETQNAQKWREAIYR